MLFICITWNHIHVAKRNTPPTSNTRNPAPSAGPRPRISATIMFHNETLRNTTPHAATPPPPPSASPSSHFAPLCLLVAEPMRCLLSARASLPMPPPSPLPTPHSQALPGLSASPCSAYQNLNSYLQKVSMP